MKKFVLLPETIEEYLQTITSRCNLWKDKALKIVIIANPNAGGFTRKKIAKHNFQVFKKIADETKPQPIVTPIINVKLIKTTAAGEARQLTTKLLSELETFFEQKNTHVLLITAGGDGTHLEVQTSLAKEAFASDDRQKLIANKITLLRLPFGTGNDGSDGRTLEEALERLTKPAHLALQRAIKVSHLEKKDLKKSELSTIDKYESLDAKAPWYAFNIASIGIDAYITYMTNKTKGILPGDFYQLWVDLACVFYGVQFPLKPVTINIYDAEDKLLKTVVSPVEFCLLGASGHRTYGSNHLILPTDDTFCTVKKMPLLLKLIKRKSFSDGTHTQSEYSIFAPAEKIIINYDQKILVQMDGEVHLLLKEHFPLTMERTKPIIPIIECDENIFNKGTINL